MRLLHTSDWHIGKTLRGHDRMVEYTGVTEEITSIAKEEAVDLVLVAGDLFDSVAPSAEAEKVAYRALISLSEVAPVCVIAGNHDNARRFKALAPLFEAHDIHVGFEPSNVSEKGLVSIGASDGTRVNVAMLPFIHQSRLVRSEALLSSTAAKNATDYTSKMGLLLGEIAKMADPESLNVLVAHAFVAGGQLGGGERPGHIVDEYVVSSQSFSSSFNYVALGHLHRASEVAGATRIAYCGSPLQMDFGEATQTKQVNIVDLTIGLPAKVKPRELSEGRKLVTVVGEMKDLENHAQQIDGDPWLKVVVKEAPRPTIAEEVKDLLGSRVVHVVADHVSNNGTKLAPSTEKLASGASPPDLLKSYLSEFGLATDDVLERFADLYEDVFLELEDSEASHTARLENLKHQLAKGGG